MKTVQVVHETCVTMGKCSTHPDVTLDSNGNCWKCERDRLRLRNQVWLVPLHLPTEIVMAKNCSNCGASNEDHARDCWKCGSQLRNQLLNTAQQLKAYESNYICSHCGASFNTAYVCDNCGAEYDDYGPYIQHVRNCK